ncbi:MAG: (d)CMP kinase [Anaerolineales bacterium]|nr:(d)CMP kinase [Anaerolineales bacterium]
MGLPSTIAIDGPAASGKSTLGKRLADELGYLFLDTGVMYRAVTWAALQRGLAVEYEPAVSALAESCEIDIRPPSRDDGRQCDILIDGVDAAWDIRRPEVDANVSLVSSYAGVRRALTEQQRRIGRRGRVVMVGRDIGTVVLPDADLKIYLDASAEERARRRYNEIIARGGQADYAEILAAMQARDAFDSSRDLAPLCAAEDAQVIDSDDLDIEGVLEYARRLLAMND